MTTKTRDAEIAELRAEIAPWQDRARTITPRERLHHLEMAQRRDRALAAYTEADPGYPAALAAIVELDRAAEAAVQQSLVARARRGERAQSDVSSGRAMGLGPGYDFGRVRVGLDRTPKDGTWLPAPSLEEAETETAHRRIHARRIELERRPLRYFEALEAQENLAEAERQRITRLARRGISLADVGVSRDDRANLRRRPKSAA